MANDQTAHQNEVMNGDEAAIFLRMPKSTLLKLCTEGQLPGVKVGRQWRFNRFALENWMRERDGEAGTLPEESVSEPVEVDFPAKLQKAETTVARQIKPVVEEMVGSVGGDDFDSVGEVRELDEFSGVSEVIEQEEEETPLKASAKPVRKTTARSTSALELMAQISEKSQGKKPSKAAPAPKEPKIRKSVQPSPAARPAFRETSRESSFDNDAVEISRPYNKPGSVPVPPAGRSERSGGGMTAFRKLAYWVVILVVLGGAGFGIKELLNPGEPAPSPLAQPKPQPSLPVLPEFQVVYKHNDMEETSAGNISTPQAAQTTAPMPAAVTETIAAPTPAATPVALVEAPTPKPIQLTPETPVRTQPIAAAPQPTVDQNLDAINRLLPSLMDLPGCIITSNKNEIRIKFEDGIFASGLKVDKKGREQLTTAGAAIAKHAPDFWLIIEGQTDGTAMRQQSPFRDNYTLGLRRGVAATEVLREDINFPAERLLVSSTGGMTQPFSSDVPNAAARNRTVILRLVPKTGPVPPSIQ
ncbi:MAG: helix-turn-helix domain-containing protein [Spartobacteria bacterium]